MAEPEGSGPKTALKPPAAVNRVGIVPSAYVSDPELKRGLVAIMSAVDLYMEWVEGAPIFDVDKPLLDDIFTRDSSGSSLRRPTMGND